METRHRRFVVSNLAARPSHLNSQTFGRKSNSYLTLSVLIADNENMKENILLHPRKGYTSREAVATPRSIVIVIALSIAIVMIISISIVIVKAARIMHKI